MAKYEVIKYFTDLQDNRHPYNVGDIFPRQGKEVTEERIAELSGSNNRQHTPLIKEVAEGKEPEQSEGTEKTANSEPAKQTEQNEVDAGNSETSEPTAEPANTENSESTTQTEQETVKKYTKADLEGMKVPQIRELAKELGFKISSMSKEDIVAEFLEKQG